MPVSTDEVIVCFALTGHVSSYISSRPVKFWRAHSGPAFFCKALAPYRVRPRPSGSHHAGATHGGGEWLAMLPGIKDQVDMVGLEAASLELGRQAGLVVPESKIVQMDESRRALLVERFDLGRPAPRLRPLVWQQAKCQCARCMPDPGPSWKKSWARCHYAGIMGSFGMPEQDIRRFGRMT